jgi:hypothetical protein
VNTLAGHGTSKGCNILVLLLVAAAVNSHAVPEDDGLKDGLLLPFPRSQTLWKVSVSRPSPPPLSNNLFHISRSLSTALDAQPDDQGQMIKAMIIAWSFFCGLGFPQSARKHRNTTTSVTSLLISPRAAGVASSSRYTGFHLIS